MRTPRKKIRPKIPELPKRPYKKTENLKKQVPKKYTNLTSACCFAFLTPKLFSFLTSRIVVPQCPPLRTTTTTIPTVRLQYAWPGGLREALSIKRCIYEKLSVFLYIFEILANVDLRCRLAENNLASRRKIICLLGEKCGVDLRNIICLLGEK